MEMGDGRVRQETQAPGSWQPLAAGLQGSTGEPGVAGAVGMERVVLLLPEFSRLHPDSKGGSTSHYVLTSHPPLQHTCVQEGCRKPSTQAQPPGPVDRHHPMQEARLVCVSRLFSSREPRRESWSCRK